VKTWTWNISHISASKLGHLKFAFRVSETWFPFMNSRANTYSFDISSRREASEPGKEDPSDFLVLGF
jgi:hypothetical protein